MGFIFFSSRLLSFASEMFFTAGRSLITQSSITVQLKMPLGRREIRSAFKCDAHRMMFFWLCNKLQGTREMDVIVERVTLIKDVYR